jgi:hypothetical protein
MCIKCGRMLTPRVTELHRAGHLDYGHHPVNVARDVELERRFTLEAARSVGVDPSSLTVFAESRTHPGPLRDVERRDWVQEIREELGDARNYACWEAQRMLAASAADDLPRIGRALAFMLLAWNELDCPPPGT